MQESDEFMMKPEVENEDLKSQSDAAKDLAAQEDNLSPGAEVSPEGAALLEEEDEGVVLAGELVKRTAECDRLKDQFLRTLAEFDNFRKRTARETDRIRKTAAETLIRDVLPVLDNLERALDHARDTAGGLAEGVQMVLTQFRDVLGAHGLEPIAALGQAFDPHVHEALSQSPSDEYAAGTVMLEFARGYRLAGSVLRPAKVVVSSGAPGNAALDEELTSPDGVEDAAPEDSE